jgi:hypothetical protein
MGWRYASVMRRDCSVVSDSAGSERRRGLAPPRRQSAGKECPHKAGSKPPSNWALSYRERERRRGGGHSSLPDRAGVTDRRWKGSSKDDFFLLSNRVSYLISNCICTCTDRVCLRVCVRRAGSEGGAKEAGGCQ